MEKDFRTLQLFYAAAVSDAAFHYGQHRIFDAVTEEKRTRQDQSAEVQLKQLGINELGDVYKRFAEIFGCTDWTVDITDDSIMAENTSCMLCSLARKQGTPQPCRPFCINPFSAYARVMGYKLDVKETLWDGEKCLFVNKKRTDHED